MKTDGALRERARTAGLRYERLNPAELEAAVERAPLAFVPIGTLEFHGPHLPFGVDLYEAHELCLRAAALAGGVVLPPAYLASGCLDMPYTLTFGNELVRAWVAATLAQLHHRGFRAVVVLTGHGPLDLNHLLKRTCAEAESACPGLAAYGLCWLELNAARMERPDEGEPTVVDHAALVETSWMLALRPGLVQLERLSADPDAQHAGVYGRNPRFTASAELGEAQVEANAELLAARARGLLEGRRPDAYGDLRRFVELAWPERLELRPSPGRAGTFLIENPGRSSRYLTSLALDVDGERVDASAVTLENTSPGETGVPVRCDSLGAESGLYLRRGQSATVELAAAADRARRRRLRAEVGLGGVTTDVLETEIELAYIDRGEN